LTQNPNSYYYDSSNNILLYCNKNTEAICTPVTNDGYYINPDTDTTASFSDHPLLLYSSSGSSSLSTVPKASVIASNEYYVDGENKDDNATKYTQLISCTVTDDSISTCTSATQTEGYYINSGSDKDTNPLIHCNGTDCETVAKVNGFYVNSGNDKDTKNLIKCNTDGCSTISSTGDTYIDASNETSSGSGNFSRLIKIASDGTITTPTVDSNYDGYYVDEFNKNDQSEYTKIVYCSTVSGTSSCSSITDFQTGYYINKAVSGTNANALIHCTVSSTCKLETGSGYYENTDDTTKIIKCTDSGCDNTTTTVGENNVYIDSGYPVEEEDNKFTKLIKCIKDTSDGNKIKCTSDGTLSDGYYIDESSKDNNVYKNIIKCTSSSCESIEVSSTNDGYYGNEMYNTPDNGKSVYTQLIKCTTTEGGSPASSCTSVSNNVTGFYLNKNVSGTNENALIHCTDSSTCKLETGSGYYENSDDTTKIINCTSSGCDNTTTTVGENNVYIDSGYPVEGENNKFTKLIKCIKDTSDGNKIKCTSDGTLSDGYYIDESSKDNNVYKNIIKCTSSSCESIEVSSTNDGYYGNEIYATLDSENKPFYSQLIKCTTTADATPTSSCTSISNNVTGFYLNKNVSGTNENALIHCTASSTCKLETGSGYYENTDDTTNIINCTDSGCDNTTTVGENNVYIDSGYPVEGQTSKFSKLIKCIKDTSDGNKIKCTSDGTLSDGYYIDESSKDNNVYKNIIKCTSSSCESIEVSSTNDGYYGNEMYNTPDNGKSVYTQLIKCTTTEGGSPASSCTSINDFVTGFYINKAVTDTNENALISCSGSSCEIKNGIKGFYLDGSNATSNTDGDGNATIIYNGIINCSINDSNNNITCTQKEELKDGFYLDGSEITDNDSVITYNGLIKCNKDDDGNITCNKDDSVADGFYMDGGNEITDEGESERKYKGLIGCVVEGSTTCALEIPNGGNNYKNEIYFIQLL